MLHRRLYCCILDQFVTASYVCVVFNAAVICNQRLSKTGYVSLGIKEAARLFFLGAIMPQSLLCDYFVAAHYADHGI